VKNKNANFKFFLSFLSGGMTELGCDSIDKLKAKLHSLDKENIYSNTDRKRRSYSNFFYLVT
jgi:hypothetical protein